MINTLYLPELREMLATGDEEGLRDFCSALHPARTAEFMQGLTSDEVWRVLERADPDVRGQIFNFLEDSKKLDIVESMEPGPISELIADMPADDRVDLLSGVEASVLEEVLPLMQQDDRRETVRLLSYPEGTAGAKMTTEVARLSKSLTVRGALEEISRQAEEAETVYYNYVVDDQNRLLGLVSGRQLVTHFLRPEMPISELMERDVVTVLVTDDQEAVAAKMANYDFLAIPVVDDDRRLLGIITHDDILDVLRAEATEDAHLSAAVDPLQQSYLETPWHTMAWKRGVWLIVLFCTSLLTAFALRGYEGDFQKATWLVLFIPLVISSGGNTGSQSATLVITALNNGDVRLSQWRRVILRELLMGACLGGALAVFGYFSAYVLTRQGVQDPLGIGAEAIPEYWEVLVVPLTLVIVVIVSTMVGGMLPILFRRLGLDPALMSNPFVSVIMDITGILIYMAVAAALIPSLF